MSSTSISPTHSVFLLLLRLSALLALAFSSASAVDAWAPAMTFCAPGEGCDVVAQSEIGRAIGAYLPALGLLSYALIFGLSLLRRPRARRIAALFALLAGLGALAFIIMQAWWIDAFCWVCMGVDSAGVVAAVAAIFLLRQETPARAPIDLPLLSSAALFLLAVALPPLWMNTNTAPPGIRELWVDGKINVISYASYTCPYCRALHPVLEKAMQPYGERIHYVSVIIPLHGDFDAAAVHHCAEQQQKGNELNKLLFFGPAFEAADYLAAARDVGVDMKQLEACLSDAETAAAIDEQIERLEKAGFKGLPTVWIGDVQIVGFDKARGAEPFEKALEYAAGQAEGQLPWRRIGFFAVIGVLFAAGLVLDRKKAAG
ncbi:MAG: thioredoxin domain-containing protein [Myxococcota bacterium]|jgi:predicted DsbA family dithiol-disulfide isomerase/uncharacterized membrane protein|nr:thioredoxin domain-containing protein [Myxococcota bacterium]